MYFAYLNSIESREIREFIVANQNDEVRLHWAKGETRKDTDWVLVFSFVEDSSNETKEINLIGYGVIKNIDQYQDINDNLIKIIKSSNHNNSVDIQYFLHNNNLSYKELFNPTFGAINITEETFNFSKNLFDFNYTKIDFPKFKMTFRETQYGERFSLKKL